MAAEALIRPETTAAAAVAVVSVLAALWFRSRGLARQRRVYHAVHILAEEIIASTTQAAILERLTGSLPGILRLSEIRVFLFDRSSNSLVQAGARPGAARVSIALEPPGDLAPALCFRNRTLLALTDVNRSEIRTAPGLDAPARAAMFVPMIRRGEPAGVLELVDAERVRDFTPDERAAAQHLANQVAAALGLLEEQSVQEQLLRTERLAASGELISGVANELRQPLESISELAARLAGSGRQLPCEGELREIAREAGRAMEVVERLVSFSHPEAEAEGSAETPPADSRPPVQPLNLLVVEPDAGAARRLLALLADRGHRAVMASSGEEAIGLAERFRFDALFSALRLPGLNWVGLFDRVRGRVRACVLLMENFDGGVGIESVDKGYLVLNKPVNPPKLEQVLAAIASRTVVE